MARRHHLFFGQRCLRTRYPGEFAARIRDRPPIGDDFRIEHNVMIPVKRDYSQRPRPAPRPRVLVVAPHPDDDVIGCGGTLSRLARRDARISVSYITDGSASHVKSRRFPPAVLRDIREGEARAALRVLGIHSEPQFLRAPDSGLARLGADARDQLIATLARRIIALRAQVIFAPWARDPHPDHVVTAAIVQAAVTASGRKPVLYSYGVWLPLRGTAADQPHEHEVRICEVRLRATEIEGKRAAIMEHRSQTGALIDDDPDGFRMDAEMLALWLGPKERFFVAGAPEAGTGQR